ncbi:MAG: AMP-binding protein, partial [Verrucomicrobiales bacterium]
KTAMEATRLMDPAFWADSFPVAPGSLWPDGMSDPQGLLWFQSSGSTGDPKWIGLTREALLLSARVVNAHLSVSDGEVWGLALPLHHVGGFGVVARAYESGCRLAKLPGKWDPGTCCAWLAREKVNHLSLVPTQVVDLVRAGCAAPSSLRTVVVGGGALQVEVGRAARALGWPVLASYGMTEAASQIATQGLELLGKPYQRFPCEGLSHWDLRVNSEGCLELSGGSLFSAVSRRVQGGQWEWVARDEEWHVTRDRVNLVGRSIQVLGRADRCVKVLGELVDLEQVESGLGVEQVAVVAIPDSRWGRKLVLVSEAGRHAEAVERYNAGVAGPWRISEVVVVSSLPRTDLGKVRHGALAEVISLR